MILRAGVAALRRDDDTTVEIIVFNILEKEMITNEIVYELQRKSSASWAESKAQASELFYPLDPRTKDSAATARLLGV